MSESEPGWSEALGSSWWYWLRRPGLAIPALYGLSSTIGMVFYWAYFRVFDIDILAYIDPSDLLLASFRRPVVWVVLILSVLAVQMDNMSSLRFGRRPRSRWTAWYGSAHYRRLNLIIGAAMVSGFIVLLAMQSAMRVREGDADTVRLTFSEDGSQVEALLVGTSSRFVFLYEPDQGGSSVYPFEALRSIQRISAAPAAEPTTATPVDPEAVKPDPPDRDAE